MTAASIARLRVLVGVIATAAHLMLAGCETAPIAPADQGTVDALLNLIEARVELAAQAAKQSWLSGAAAEMPGEGEERVDSAVNRALEFTLPPELVREFFSAQLAAAVYVRSTLHEQWHAQGEKRPPASADQPSQLRRPVIEASDTPLLAALSQAYPILRRPGGRDLLIRRAEQLLARIPGGAKTMTLVLVPLLTVAN